MFGEVRASSWSLDSLERPSSKIIKDDPLSIYEATLVKLKVGAKRDLSSNSESAMEIVSDCTSETVTEFSQHTISSPQEAMAVEAESFTECASPSSSDCQSTGSTKQHLTRNVSIFQLFSKYGKSQHNLNSSLDDAMTIENDCSASSSTHSCCYQTTSEKERQLQHECISS